MWPKAQEFGFPNQEAAFALQMGHGIGLAIWEKPMISRLVSLDHPHEIEPGMVFALETFWPSTDGWSAARIEEEIVVTPTGHEIITRFPCGTAPGRGRPACHRRRHASDAARGRGHTELGGRRGLIAAGARAVAKTPEKIGAGLADGRQADDGGGAVVRSPRGGHRASCSPSPSCGRGDTSP